MTAKKPGRAAQKKTSPKPDVAQPSSQIELFAGLGTTPPRNPARPGISPPVAPIAEHGTFTRPLAPPTPAQQRAEDLERDPRATPSQLLEAALAARASVTGPVRADETKETTSLGIVDAGRARTEQGNWSPPRTVVTAGETAPSSPQTGRQAERPGRDVGLAAEVAGASAGSLNAEASRDRSERRPPYKPATAAAWREEISERAAIYEYEANHPRGEAERLAMREVGDCPKETR